MTADQSSYWVDVAVDVPRPDLFTYTWTLEEPPQPGMRVVIPWGNKKRVGIVWTVSDRPPGYDVSKLKGVLQVLNECPPLGADWRLLMEFAASYYHYPIGQAAIEALPKSLRTLGTKGSGLQSVKQLLKRLNDRYTQASGPTGHMGEKHFSHETQKELTLSQAQVMQALQAATGFEVSLLFGITGSGKTEVYLRRVMQVCNQGRQCLILLPEINLTPQAEGIFKTRLAGLKVVILNSAMADMGRLENWWLAMAGHADVVIGTRLSVFTPLPRLGLVVVDEEHDASYKQMDGLKYSARDLAITRAHQAGCPVILGSATPSLESWHKATTGVYRLLQMTDRAVALAKLPAVELINTQNHPMHDGLAEPVLAALKQTFEKGEQSIVFLNRRGYAPVLACGACGWVAGCRQCSSHVVWHRTDRVLRCHHCGAQQDVPRHCPSCGNQDLSPFGRGTQRLEEALAQSIPGARLLRIDADTTRNKGEAEAAFEQVHTGQADILIGTQMVAKGHDFKRVSLVVALNVDAALFSSQARAPERLFAQLMQVSGRAGRHGLDGRVMIQTRYPHHPLFEALVRHDYPQFAAEELEARKQAHMPPFAFQALLRADHRQLTGALEFLQLAKQHAQALLPQYENVWVCDAVPLNVVKVAGVERAQLLVESASRLVLHRFLDAWLPLLWAEKGSTRWFLEVDPQDV